MHHIINHSESVFLFVSDRIWDTLEEEMIEDVRGVFSLSDFRCLHQRDGESIQKLLKGMDEKMAEKYPDGFGKDDIEYAELDNDKVVLLNYTSGTTGFSKGVMLTGNNLAGNVMYGIELGVLYRGERELCFLPLAHAYSCAFNFLVPMAVGAHVYLLGKVPSPKILLKAFEVKPKPDPDGPVDPGEDLQEMILPQLSKTTMKVALNIPLHDTVDSTGISHEDLPIIMEQNRIELNKLLAPYEAVSALQLYPTEFEKTPKKSIKRYLYSNY